MSFAGDRLAANRGSFAHGIQNAGSLAVAAWGAVALGIGLRLFALRDMSLWLDESWTGAIIAQESLREVLHQSLLDANAPLYFALMHGWSLLFGLSNGALRFPALVFSALAPLLALIPIRAIPRDVRYLWCLLIALWIPAVWYAQEARCYTMLLFLTTGCTVAYAHLLAQPDLRRAVLWALIGALCVLTHYHALILLGCQGFAYLALHRWRAVQTWPAALIFVPALAWTLVHLPRVLQFTDPQVTWFPRLELGHIPGIIFFVLGSVQAAIGLTCLALISFPLILLRVRRRRGVPAPDTTVPKTSAYLWIVVATAALGLALVLAVATVSTSFTTRYVIPFMPGLMLGSAITAVRLSRYWAPIPIAIAFVFAISGVMWAAEQRGQDFKVYNFQAASESLRAADVRDLVFLFDNPIGQISDSGQLADLGGFFFRRAGRPIAVEPITVRSGEDPNQRLLAAANKQPESGIIWLYDLGVRGTAAREYPPRIAESDPAWRCRQFGRGNLGVLACHRGPRSRDP